MRPLQHVTGIVERRHTLPILSNVLIQAHGGVVDFVATDLEVQITAKATLDGDTAEGAVTVAARKLYDILRSLPDDAEVALDAKENRMVVRAGKSRFNLQTLAAADFPRMVEAQGRHAHACRCRRRRSSTRSGSSSSPWPCRTSATT